MKVIVAGMPKTGTKSMNQALTRLGYKVYDVLENSYYLGQDYTKIVSKGWTTEDFRRMYEDVDSVVDLPAQFFWDEIHKAFPDAKIVLTMRENEDAWVKSLARQFEANESNFLLGYILCLSPSYRKMWFFAKKLIPTALGIQVKNTIIGRKADQFNLDMMKRMYRAHNAYVQHSAPKDKLLVFNCSEGWEPLCKFLGIPVPDEPFPHKNIKGDIVNEMVDYPIMKRMQREAMVSATILLTTTVVTGVVIYKYGVRAVFNGLHTRVVTVLGRFGLA